MKRCFMLINWEDSYCSNAYTNQSNLLIKSIEISIKILMAFFTEIEQSKNLYSNTKDPQ